MAILVSSHRWLRPVFLGGASLSLAVTMSACTDDSTGSDASADTATVPSLTGDSLESAEDLLQDEDLKLGQVEKEPSASEPGTVLKQSEDPGAVVPLGTVVELVVASAMPRVPSVVGLNAGAAERQLEKEGFDVERRMETDSSAVSGTVVSQSPHARDRVEPKSTVIITVAK